MKTTLTRAAFATVTAASLLLSLPVAAFATETPSGGVACPVNTAPAAFEQFSVLPNGLTTSSSALVNGRTYLVEASGTYTFAPGMGQGSGIADAAYSLRAPGYNNASTGPEWIDGAVFSSPYQNWLELWINDSAVAWGAFNPAHVYTTSVVGTGAALDFKILDNVYSDNSGSLTVKLTACVPVEQPPVLVSCPVGTVKTLVENVMVPAGSSVATPSVNVLANGKDYLFVASGTWTNSNNLADAEYITKDAWATHADGYNVAPYFLGEGSFDLKVNGAFVNWGAYAADHTYARLETGAGALASLLIFDGDADTNTQEVGWYGDNSGSLNVAIFACEVLPPPPPVADKNACKKGGWTSLVDNLGNHFKNQGDCVSYFATKGQNKAAGN